MVSNNRVGLAFTGCMLSALVFVSGCGGGGKCTATGKVLLAGKPVYGGMVTLIGDKDQTAQGAIELDGTYTVRDAPTGKVKVGVVSAKPVSQGVDRGGRNAPGAPTIDASKWFAVPEKYGDPNSSGKEITLKGGTNTQDIVLE